MIEICKSRSDIFLPGNDPQGCDYIHSASRDENEDDALHLLSHVMIMPRSKEIYGRNVNVGRDVRRGFHLFFARRGEGSKLRRRNISTLPNPFSPCSLGSSCRTNVDKPFL